MAATAVAAAVVAERPGTRVLRRVYDRWVPELWRQRIHLARGGTDVFLPCFRETGTIFVHVPKAAGTSISRAIYGGNVGHRRALDYQRISARHFARYFRFGFVRDPWERLVSAYGFVRSGGTGFVKPIPDPVYDSPVFSSFGSFVTDWLATADLTSCDVVFRPQWTFLCDDEGRLLVDHVGRTERLVEDLGPVEEVLGRPVRPEHLNRGVGSVDPHPDTPELRAVVADVYRRDYELFDYDPHR